MEDQELGAKLGLEEGVAPMGVHGEESELDSNEVERELERFGMSDVESAAPSVDKLAAIPEASPVQAMARRSKRQAVTADEVCLDKAERLKSSRLEGDTNHPNSFINFSDELITSSYSSIGITLGSDFTSVKGWIAHLKKVESDRLHVLHVVDKKTNVLEIEENELADEVELDKLILNHLCGDIMEVMDLGNDQFDLIDSKNKPKFKKNKKGQRIHIPNSL